MSAGNVARVVAVLAACVAAVGSASSSSNQKQSMSGPGNQASPPAPQQMEAVRALGLWRSTFGAVKIEPDNSKGGLDAGSLQGIWVYQRQGQEVIGYFAGSLQGNVLQFHWQEPNDPPLTGEGFLVFDVQGRQYSGRWWSERRDRIGDWNGWRQTNAQGARPYLETTSPYGGQGYGGDPVQAPPPRQRQTYRPQPGPYQQPYQPSQPGPYQQPYQPSQPQPGPYQQPYQPSQPQSGPYQQPYQPSQPQSGPYQQPYQPSQPQPGPYQPTLRPPQPARPQPEEPKYF